MSNARKVPAAQQSVTSAKILALRAKCGNPCTMCPTCVRPAACPYRVVNARGKVEAGCVDACHQGHLIGESAYWHARPEAHALRKQELATLSSRH